MKPITILYGTETGNAEYCANQIGLSLQKRNMDHQIIDMQDCVHADLPEMDIVLIVQRPRSSFAFEEGSTRSLKH